MMKQTIKRVLQERQRKEYRKELASQLRDYDSWIRGQEAPLLVSGHVAEKSGKSFSVSDYTWISCSKCLTNESKLQLDGGAEMKNVRSKRVGSPAVLADYRRSQPFKHVVRDLRQHQKRIF